MTEIITTRSCDQHAPATLTWDYTVQGDCPVCEKLGDIKNDLVGMEIEISDSEAQAEEARAELIDLKEDLVKIKKVVSNIEGLVRGLLK